MIDEFDRYTFARRLFDEGRYREAARELEGLLEAAAGDGPTGTGEARLLLARAYHHSAQVGRAEEAARALVTADPTDTYAMLLLARVLQRRGRAAEADRWFARIDALEAA